MAHTPHHGGNAFQEWIYAHAGYIDEPVTMWRDADANGQFGAADVVSLGKAAIAGSLLDAAWTVTGPVKTVAAGRWGAGSRLSVSVHPGGDGNYFTGDDLVQLPICLLGSLTIRAYDAAHAHDFGVLAAGFGRIKLAGVSRTAPFTDTQFRIVRVV